MIRIVHSQQSRQPKTPLQDRSDAMTITTISSAGGGDLSQKRLFPASYSDEYAADPYTNASIVYEDDTTEQNSHGANQGPPCFSLLHKLLPSSSLDERKSDIAATASKVDPTTRQRVVPVLQILDVEHSMEPLLLLDLLDRLFRACHERHFQFPCGFGIKETNSTAEVYMGPNTADPPAFDVIVCHSLGYKACLSMDEAVIGKAFLNGQFQVHGDLVQALLCFQDLWKHTTATTSWTVWNQLRRPQSTFWFPAFSQTNTITRQQRVASHHLHYDRGGNLLPLLALERDFDSYSPGLYLYDEEDMEPAAQRKLAHAFEQLELRAGDWLLDVGCGWGGMMRYAANKGCHVTGLTLSRDQAEYVAGHLKLRYFAQSTTVLCQDVFTYQPMFQPAAVGGSSSNSTPQRDRTSAGRPCSSNGSCTEGPEPGLRLYDAVTVLGTLEELGNDYDAILATLVRFLKPGGRIYLDFAAQQAPPTATAREFVTRYIYPMADGATTPSAQWVHLPTWLQAVERSAVVLESLHDNRHNYYLWARKCYDKLVDKHDEFLQQYEASQNLGGSSSDGTTFSSNSREASPRGGEALYRTYLTMFAGAAAAMIKPDHQCTAYRMVLKLPEGYSLV